MKIKRGPVVFNNVISAKARTDMNEWFHAAREFRNAIIKNGLYSTGPIIYQVANIDEAANEADYIFYVPVNRPVEMKDSGQFSFIELFEFPDVLIVRHADLEEDIEETYDILRECADAYTVKISEPFYNIYLDVYGDGMIDVFAPIVEEGSND
ncbi:DUF5085 family protein [Evansella cellulosilytica]|uniref:DUF5085 domain-containing protein n=1 Tax=Evansella cellulosilytica (strain ATCC 21833 / DSM 2522 / FERM P-1141 / JCM 9156 / N-4) TaxID=649639 RepID=E6TRH3_EVAC2|nr:DUF5085 family protein [Evansella cellulosilytica]ADU31803.1 hypothetical protein Bcell_3562 [Evansella cellulosilytica DSM 2522]